eukprot:JP437675.1.p1 GENE.JP437675.1~~JP437675.1.p1  ORF type:complete len:93 (-),score=3.66 JP437675.1:19-297(-)
MPMCVRGFTWWNFGATGARRVSYLRCCLEARGARTLLLVLLVGFVDGVDVCGVISVAYSCEAHIAVDRAMAATVCCNHDSRPLFDRAGMLSL